MHQLNAHKAGLTLGSLFGLVHLVWSLMVAVGWAQPYLDFVFGVHMISNPYVVQAFSWGRAIGLIVVTAIVGYVIGYVFGKIWNKVHA
jgi:hypothetical protein